MYNIINMYWATVLLECEKTGEITILMKLKLVGL